MVTFLLQTFNSCAPTLLLQADCQRFLSAVVTLCLNPAKETGAYLMKIAFPSYVRVCLVKASGKLGCVFSPLVTQHSQCGKDGNFNSKPSPAKMVVCKCVASDVSIDVIKE